jgi:hypothetical protein
VFRFSWIRFGLDLAASAKLRPEHKIKKVVITAK